MTWNRRYGQVKSAQWPPEISRRLRQTPNAAAKDRLKKFFGLVEFVTTYRFWLRKIHRHISGFVSGFENFKNLLIEIGDSHIAIGGDKNAMIFQQDNFRLFCRVQTDISSLPADLHTQGVAGIGIINPKGCWK